MQAIILAGGKGTRLKPYTTILPKPLMPIEEYPILEIIIKQLNHFGVKEITLAVGHLKELIQAFFNDGKRWNVKIKYSMEEKPLGTAAPLKLLENLEDNFLVMNGDVLTNLNFRDFFDYHLKNKAYCTIATYRKPVNIDLGVIKTDDKNILYDYIEKPTLDYQVSMGVYAFKKEVLEYIPTNEYLDFPSLIHLLLKDQKKVAGYPFRGHWLDIGRPEDYSMAIEVYEKHKSVFLWEN
ncbi:MAG: NTP transferase domain-containing protein [bacterium]|nr:MAG: NTP transferase domain-containing protein [bacterium]